MSAVDPDASSAQAPLVAHDGLQDAERVAPIAEVPEPESNATPTWENVPGVALNALFRYASGPERCVLVVALLAAMISSAQTPALSFYMKDLTECIFASKEQRHERVSRVFLTFLSIGVAGWIVTSAAVLGFQRVADKMSHRMRVRFFSHLMMKEVGWYDVNNSSEMATRLTQDAYDFRQGAGSKFALFVQNMLQAPLGFMVAFIRDWKFTLILMGVVPLIGIVFGMTMKVMTTNVAKQAEYYARAGGVAETTISSIQTVAAFGGYKREITKYDQRLADAERDGVKAGVSQGIASGAMAILFNGIFALGLFVGSLFMLSSYNNNCWDTVTGAVDGCFNGSIMISVLFAVIIGGFGMAQALQQMGAIVTSRVAAARMYKVIDEPLAYDLDDGFKLEAVRGDIAFSNVSFSYPTRPETRALDGVSYVITAGTTAAFVGPSGSGKSTSISLLMRFYDPGSGVVTLDGHDIKRLNTGWMRRQMALVQQEPILFEGTIMSNILYGKAGATQQEARDAAKAANAHDFVSAFQEGYETAVGERGATLSGGQKQRVAIARAMIRDPKILLLDEATSALDTDSERLVKQAIDKILAQRSRTTLMVAHRLSTIKDAGIIFVLEDGKLVEQGTHEELLRRDGGLYQQLVELQDLAQDGSLTPAELSHNSGLVRQLSRRSSGQSSSHSSELPNEISNRQLERHGSGLPNQTSGASAEERFSAEAPQLPEEDERPMTVPTSRLWQMQKVYARSFFIALFATVPMSAAGPVVGRLFGNSIGVLSEPPALPLGPRGTWVKAFDQSKIQDAVKRTCVDYGVLTVLQFTSILLSVSNYRRASEGLTRTVRRETFTAILRQEMAYFDFRSSGQLADRLAHEASMIKSFAGESFGGFVQMIVGLIVALALSLYSSWALTLTIMFLMPLMMLARIFQLNTFKKKDETRAGPVVSEAMANIRTIAAFGLQPQMQQRYSSVLDVEVKEDRRQGNATGVAQGYSTFVQFLMYGTTLLVSSFYIDTLGLDPTNVLQVFFTLLFTVGSVSQGATQWQGDKAKGEHAVRHIFNTLDRKPLIDAYDEQGLKLDVVRGEVSFVNVAFSYPTQPQTNIFVDFDIRISPGMSVAFVGPSGSGKSTTVRLLQRFYNPDSGSICLDGHDIRTLNLAWLRLQMSLVQQEPVLFSGTILDNIKYGKEGSTDEEALKAAKDANAHNFIMGFPEEYNTRVGERGAQLSGGQKQRVAIARCVIRAPKVLLLDEATSALDAESERVVQEALDGLLAKSQFTTLVIAHRLSTIQSSDMICVIYEGKIVESGTHNELMKIPDGQYRRLAARQQL
eukprot:CAMPEP_0117518808 /NCGR_PEP_ID=MMETSP0784-20121206/32325_1 /TAXON_ID=39447 /ORGANISM="" /LENGTH=1313 /DNA_ID=CAMNT_0005314745 /DNA_START=22 /DNA_END=3963 /DNA_ORIENTATION=+